LKVLILKPSSLGDVIQALPVLRLIKAHLPESQVYWWIDSNLAPILEGDPDLAGLVPFERRRWAMPKHWPEMTRSIRWMRAQRFDWVIDLQSLARSGAFAWLANGELLVGLDEPREGARGFYDLIARRPSWFTHAVDWYLEVLPLLGVPVHRNFTWLPVRTAAAEAVRERWPTTNPRCIILQPGARWLNKRWPAEHFGQVVQTLAAQHHDLFFAVLGGREDESLGKQIAAKAPERCVDLTGKLSLSEMIEWIRRSAAMVTNDTGPMHVAAALGIPVTALFGPTSPNRTGPYGQIDRVSKINLWCAPCMKSRCSNPNVMECLKSISPTKVVDEVNRVLSAPVHLAKSNVVNAPTP
jgi:heptosyltransferase-1